MAAKHSLHVALTEPLVAFVADEVVRGNYASASAVVQAALRLLQAEEQSTKGAGLPNPNTASTAPACATHG